MESTVKCNKTFIDAVEAFVHSLLILFPACICGSYQDSEFGVNNFHECYSVAVTFGAS